MSEKASPIGSIMSKTLKAVKLAKSPIKPKIKIVPRITSSQNLLNIALLLEGEVDLCDQSASNHFSLMCPNPKLEDLNFILKLNNYSLN